MSCDGSRGSVGCARVHALTNPESVSGPGFGRGPLAGGEELGGPSRPVGAALPLLRRAARFFTPYQGRLALICTLIAASSVIGLANPYLLKLMIKDPPILLLDEATSALDSVSERHVQEALERAMVGRTTIAVAHRLSTVASADQILVLDHGRIVERGRHAVLRRAGGLYGELAEMQFGMVESGAP